MSRKLFALFLIASMLFSCQFVGGDKPLRIRKLTTFYSQPKQDGWYKTEEEFYYEDSEYFEIGLWRIAKGGHEANKVIKGSKDPEKIIAYKADQVKIFIIEEGEKGVSVSFESPAEFLNYMSDRGYEMKTETREEYGIVYTFKK